MPRRKEGLGRESKQKSSGDGRRLGQVKTGDARGVGFPHFGMCINSMWDGASYQCYLNLKRSVSFRTRISPVFGQLPNQSTLHHSGQGRGKVI